MHSLKFKTKIDYLNLVVRDSEGLLVEVKKLDETFCQVEITSNLKDDEQRNYQLLDSIVRIAGECGGNNIEIL